MRTVLAAGAASAALLISACRTTAPFDLRRRAELADGVISRWSEPSRLKAAKLIEQYGPPDAIAEGALGWSRSGPWKRIIIWDAVRVDASGDVEQAVAYQVPEDRRGAVAQFDRGVQVSPDGGELSARSQDEGLNYLALNLADEIVRGARGPGEARRFYDRTVELGASGKASRYALELLFPPQD